MPQAREPARRGISRKPAIIRLQGQVPKTRGEAQGSPRSNRSAPAGGSHSTKINSTNATANPVTSSSPADHCMQIFLGMRKVTG
jgi:hypothetical protein